MTESVNSYGAYLAQVNQIKAEYEAKKALLKVSSAETDDPYDKDPPPANRIAAYAQETDDVLHDTRQNARAIGDLTRGKTRLNLFSALTNADRADWYSFNVTKDNPTVGLSFTLDSNSKGGIHIQIIAQNGAIIADNAARSGDAKENYDDLTASKLELSKGTYYLKVARAVGDLNTTRPTYAIQLSASRYYREDYQTVERPVSQYATLFSSANTQSVASMSSVLSAAAGGDLFDLLL